MKIKELLKHNECYVAAIIIVLSFAIHITSGQFFTDRKSVV